MLFERVMFAPAHYLDEDTPPTTPCPGPRLFLTRSNRCELPVDTASVSCKFVINGEETYVIGGRAHRLLPGDFIVIDAGATGHIDIPRKEGTAALSIFLGRSAGESLLPGYGPVTRPPVDSHLGKLLRLTAESYAAQPGSLPHDVGPLICEIAAATGSFARDAIVKLRNMHPRRPGTRQDVLARLEKARAYLDANHGPPQSLEELGRVAGMSPFHLARQFKSVFGVSPISYYRRIRLDRMAQRLRAGDITPSAAAEMLGYSDLPSFTRAFKSRTGAPPSAFRPR